MAAAAAAVTITSLAIRAAASSTSSTSTISSTSSSASSTNTADPNTETRPPVYRVVGIILAISSGFFIGTSFVIKKIGLLKANKKYNEEAGEGYGYLKNAWWWLGMTLMIIGEICNFVAYAFVDAILVTPMGSLSVVISTILSSIFLKERLSFVGWVGCFQCIVGSIIIVVNAPENSAVATIQQMQHYVIAPGFLTYAGVILAGSVFIALWAGPRYGKKSMLVYLSICSLIGGLSVVATQGLGAAIVAQIGGIKQYNQWFLYVLFVFVIGTLLTEIIYLNKALNIFNASIVTPTYYVYFTSATIATSAILFQGLDGTALQIVTLVLGFLVICSGVVLLQLSKSSKDVPDTAVFSGDLDQIRTIAEVKEPESEPKADSIRGGAALLRTFSKNKLKREAEEADRIQKERLEPIGEDEQVEWDGLRRRKTVLVSGQPSLRRRKTVHPPWGLTRLPADDDSDNESHRPEDDHGMFPSIFNRRRTQTSRLGGPHRNDTMTSQGPEPAKDSSVTATVPLSPIKSGKQRSGAYAPHDGSHDNFENEDSGDLSSQHFPTYRPPSSLRRNVSIGLSGLQAEDTEYKSPTSTDGENSGSNLKWNITAPAYSEAFDSAPPPPPPHSQQTSQTDSRQRGGHRQFSFTSVFNRGPSPSRPSTSSTANIDDNKESLRPGTSASHSSFGSRMFSGMRRNVSGQHQQLGGGISEEERLGLVHGDSRTGFIPADLSPAREDAYEDYSYDAHRTESPQREEPVPQHGREIDRHPHAVVAGDESDSSSDSNEHEHRGSHDHSDNEDEDDRQGQGSRSFRRGRTGPQPPPRNDYDDYDDEDYSNVRGPTAFV